MSLQLGDTAPNFTAVTTLGEINFYEWLGESWGILFSHPADFTPVCTTELGAVARLSDEFKKRNTKVIALSVDSLDSHFSWISDINETQQALVNFPIIADPLAEIAKLYGTIHPQASEKHTVRAVFIIGPDKKIKLTLTYPASTGRNFEEIIRVVDSLQLTFHHSVATPANWKNGEEVVIVPAISDEAAHQKFPKGFRSVKSYLRLTPQPDIDWNV